MADNQGGRKKPKSKSNAMPAFQFVSSRLNSDDEAWLAQADLGAEFPLELVVREVQMGYKFSIREHKQGEQFVATLSDVREDSENYQRALSGWGATALDAWYALAYRHFIKHSDGWPEGNNDAPARRWG